MKTDEEVAREMQAQEYEVYSGANPNRDSYGPPPPSHFMGSAMSYQPPMVIPITQRDVKFQNVLRFSRFVKWMSIVDSVICLLFIFGLFPLMILIFLPIMGFLSSQKLNRKLAIGYLVCLAVIAILRLLLAIFAYYWFFRILQILIIIFEIVVARYVLKFYSLLGTLTEQERQELLILQNGIYYPNQGALQYPNQGLQVNHPQNQV